MKHVCLLAMWMLLGTVACSPNPTGPEAFGRSEMFQLSTFTSAVDSTIQPDPTAYDSEVDPEDGEARGGTIGSGNQ